MPLRVIRAPVSSTLGLTNDKRGQARLQIFRNGPRQITNDGRRNRHCSRRSGIYARRLLLMVSSSVSGTCARPTTVTKVTDWISGRGDTPVGHCPPERLHENPGQIRQSVVRRLAVEHHGDDHFGCRGGGKPGADAGLPAAMAQRIRDGLARRLPHGAGGRPAGAWACGAIDRVTDSQ